MPRQLAMLFSGAAIFLATLCHAQEIKVEGRFLKDSTKIGEIIPYSLSVSYPSQINLVFPDSTFDFSPFEWVSKEEFPTRTKDGMSRDSAIYYISTFELEQVQRLAMPVYSVVKRDSLAIYAAKDSIYLLELIQVMPEDPKVVSLTDWLDLEFWLNYPLYLLLASLALIALILAVLVYGKTAYRAWKSARAKRRYQKLYRRFYELMRKSEHIEKDEMQKHLVYWQSYMEKMSGKPYRKLVAKEIAGLGISATAVEGVRNLERWFYGNIPPEDLKQIYTGLIVGANDALDEKIAQIKGK